MPPSDSPPLEALEDGALLRRWLERRDEAAVRVLTQRHASLVMATARRALHGNQSLAEEATQSVFTVMVAKAAVLTAHPALSLWLHRAALLEASDLRRRESRRQRRLATLAAELDVMNTRTVDPAWHAALPELDEAVERLPANDRRLLMLRFYEGRNFKDIAARLGKTDDTVQKQASRALEKLAVLLRGRGVVISATVLGAGLAAGGLSRTASAAFTTGDFAGTAITNAPHLGFASLSWHTVKLMSLGKLNTVAALAALLLFALSAGGGYFTGQAAEADSLAASGTGKSGRQRLAESFAPGVSKTAASRGSGPAAVNRSENKPPLADILEAASTIRVSLTGEWSQYSENIYPTLGYYELSDTEDAIGLLPEFRADDGKFESVSGLIFSVLAENDWRTAKERLGQADALSKDGKLSGQAVRAVAEAWGREDPAAAFRWANDLITAGRTPFDPERGTGEKLLSAWLARDPAAALSEMDRRLNSQTPLVGKAVRHAIVTNPEWWRARLTPETPADIRNQTLRLARSSLVMLKQREREALVGKWVTDPALASEILQPAP